MGGRSTILFFALLAVSLTGTAQQIQLIGHLLDGRTNSPIPFGNIVIPEIGRGTVSDETGLFVLQFPQCGSYQVKASCIGYARLDSIVLVDSTAILDFYLFSENQTLKGVTVIAEEKEGMETTSTINQAAMRHLQPSSFADLPELLPGGTSGKIDLTDMQMITLREAGSAGRSNYMSSLGTAFVIDGMPLSNDGSMQNVSGTYSGEALNILSRNATGKGVDMRAIPTDDIESVEVIRGIPSVKYGDLSSGVVNIRRSYRKTPYRTRLKSSPHARQLALSKGFELNRRQSLNVNFDYIKYLSDPRDIKNIYSRFTSSIRYKNKPRNQSVSHHLIASLDYSGSFDRQKIDPEIDFPQTDRYHNAYHKVSVHTTNKWLFNDWHWWDELKVRFAGSYTSEQKEIDRLTSSGRTIPTVIGDKTGVQDGFYLPPSYQSYLTVDGRPLYLFGEVINSFSLTCLGMQHTLMAGGDWRYDKNFGNGEVFDPWRPPYPNSRIRPRATHSIPSMQKLSVFVEDHFIIPAGTHKVEVMAGLRLTTVLNLSAQYRMNNRFYADPRININWQLPALHLLNRQLTLSLHAGYGRLSKFPALTHLYPTKYYIDIMQLNYGSNNENISRLNYITYIEDPTNFNLEPAVNQKWETGIWLKSGAIKLNITAFREEMQSGFSPLTQYNIYSYTDYDETSVSYHDLTAPPELSRFTPINKALFGIYRQWVNGGLIIKEGVEYLLDMGTISLLSSQLSVNGAWFKTRYDQSMPEYRTSSVILNGDAYPYMGYYKWDQGRIFQRFNTNLRVDTRIKSLGLIFSSLLQTVWFSGSQYAPHNGMPDSYIDLNDKQYPYRPDDSTDPFLRHLYDKPSENEFDERREPIDMALNLKVCKRIGSHINFAFYVNSLLTYLPDYHRTDGTKVKRKRFPWFGMELNINL